MTSCQMLVLRVLDATPLGLFVMIVSDNVLDAPKSPCIAYHRYNLEPCRKHKEHQRTPN